ncbi:MAG: hypothetical protein HKP12_13265 [Gammaproteobacteria bacterium]|nr:hypothetical protein [Gammaproteobacteria bacterium]NNJ98117.1 hypothetical protein [Gammaproteobacteria bacterium]
MNEIWQTGLCVILLMGLVTRSYSLCRRNVNIVDSLWSLLIRPMHILPINRVAATLSAKEVSDD